MKTAAQLRDKLKTMQVEHRKNTSYRMENYMNCIDDYSYGGICDQAQDIAEQRIEALISIMDQQEEAGGSLVKDLIELELQTIEGKFVFRKIVQSKFGYCFIFGSYDNPKFISVSKKQQTYEAKGYRCVTRKITYHCQYDGSMTKLGNFVFSASIANLEEKVEKMITDKFDNLRYELHSLRTDYPTLETFLKY